MIFFIDDWNLIIYTKVSQKYCCKIYNYQLLNFKDESLVEGLKVKDSSILSYFETAALKILLKILQLIVFF
jgi:hypothetical protein